MCMSEGVWDACVPSAASPGRRVTWLCSVLVCVCDAPNSFLPSAKKAAACMLCSVLVYYPRLSIYIYLTSSTQSFSTFNAGMATIGGVYRETWKGALES